MEITIEQIAQLIAHSKSGRIDYEVFQSFLNSPESMPKVPARGALDLLAWGNGERFQIINLDDAPKSIPELQGACVAAQCKIERDTLSVMVSALYVDEHYESSYRVAMTTVGLLGFAGSATLQEIYQRLIVLGYTLCPAVVGVMLRLQYTDQPRGDGLLVAMEPLNGASGSSILYLACRDSGERCLLESTGHPGYRYGVSTKFAFACSD